jgi:hypothetical protein
MLIVAGLLAIGVAVADLATGESTHPLLPTSINNVLTQEWDAALLLAGAGSIFYAVNYA